MPAWAMWFCMCGQSRAGFLLGTAPVGGRLAWPGEVPAENLAAGPAGWGLLRKWTAAPVHSPWGGQVPGQLLTALCSPRWVGRQPLSSRHCFRNLLLHPEAGVGTLLGFCPWPGALWVLSTGGQEALGSLGAQLVGGVQTDLLAQASCLTSPSPRPSSPILVPTAPACAGWWLPGMGPLPTCRRDCWNFLERLPTARMLCVRLPWKPSQASQGLEKHRAGHSLISHVTLGPGGPSAACGVGLG